MNRRVAVDPIRRQVVELTWESDALLQVAPRPDLTIEPTLPFVSPGWVDIQINGVAGINFGDPDLTFEQTDRAVAILAEHGVTHFLPTLITDSSLRMERALQQLGASANRSSLGGAILGIHMEGPYLSPNDGPRGAHPLQHCKLPDWEEFCRWQDAAQGHVRLMTLAPELEGSVDFIRKATASGVRIAIGHTAADRDEMLAAVDAGATLATHLGNAAADMIQRHHNTIYDQLGEDRLHASLIVDGHHLPPHVVKIFVRAKGPERIILVSDAVQYAGLPPGVYDGGYRQFEVRGDGFIGVVGEPRLAGSGLLLPRAIENFTRFMDGSTAFPLVENATVTPRRWLDPARDFRGLEEGGEASLVFFRWNAPQCQIAIEETIRRGTTIYQRSV